MRLKVTYVSMIFFMAAFMPLGVEVTRAQQSATGDSLIEKVYVIGQVVAPRAIDYKAPLGVAEAVAMAGGVLPDWGGAERVRIYRRESETKVLYVMIVDLKSITKHRASDTSLHANDIVEVLSKKSIKQQKKLCPKPPCQIVVRAELQSILFTLCN